MRRRRLRAHATRALLAFYAVGGMGCTGGDGADGAAPASDPVAAASRSTDAEARSAWIRVTPRGLEALPATLRASIGEGLTLPLPRTRRDDLTLCAAGACEIQLQLDSLSASLRGGGELGLAVSARAHTTRIPVRYEQSWPCAFTSRPECAVTFDTRRHGPPAIQATAELRLQVDRATGWAGLVLAEPRVPQGLDAGDVHITGGNTCGHVWCSVANLAGASSWVAERANTAIVETIRSEADARICLPCAAGSCPGGSRCEAGTCRSAGGCVPRPLAAGTTVTTAEGTRGVHLGVTVADVAEIRRGGLELALRLSAAPEARDPCAPPALAPTPEPLPRRLLDAGADRGALRVVLGEAAIARVLWALHQAGVGCVDVGADEIPPLRAGLAALLPSARRITSGGPGSLGVGAPTVSLRLLAPPTAHLREDGTLALEARIRIEIWAEVEGRSLRVAAATSGVSGVARLSMQNGSLSLETPRSALEVRRIDTWSAPLLGAGERELGTTFDALLQVALAVVPETTPLSALPLPGRASLAGAPRTVEVDGVRALMVELDLAPEPAP